MPSDNQEHLAYGAQTFCMTYLLPSRYKRELLPNKKPQQIHDP